MERFATIVFFISVYFGFIVILSTEDIIYNDTIIKECEECILSSSDLKWLVWQESLSDERINQTLHLQSLKSEKLRRALELQHYMFIYINPDINPDINSSNLPPEFLEQPRVPRNINVDQARLERQRYNNPNYNKMGG